MSRDPNLAVARPLAGLEFSPEEIGEAARTGRLLSVELEMTHACNLRCVYCYAEAGRPEADEMSFAEIQDAVQQAVDLGARKVVVLGGGEPCLYPRFRDLVEHLDGLGVDTEVFTNGTMIDRGLARFLHQHRVSVVVKRNAADPAVQDALAGVPGTFDQIQGGIEALMAAGYPDAEHGLGVQTVICRHNLAEIPKLWRWARSRGILPYFECMTTQGRAAHTPSLDVTRDELRAVFHDLCRMDREEFGLEWTPHPPLVASRCARHLYSILIRANGDLYPCVGVAVTVGNLRRDRLAEVLRAHPVIQDLRDVYARIKGRCRRCRFNGHCYGCRGNAFQLTGDYLASDPCCWMDEEEPGEADTAKRGRDEQAACLPGMWRFSSGLLLAALLLPK
jgi:radical SAM protein with 4Fe4S-binding SPASM domain